MVVVLAVAVLAAAGLGACYPAPQTNVVVAIGDSLLLGAEQQGLADRLRGLGLSPEIDAEGGRPADRAVALVDAATRGRRTGVLYLGLGTNDGTDRASFRSDIEAIMAAARGWPVVWSLVEWPKVLGLNDELRAARDRHPNLALIDFTPEVTARPWYRATDGVHLVPAGYVARAAHIAAFCDRYRP